jgi:hypothetical protein
VSVVLYVAGLVLIASVAWAAAGPLFAPSGATGGEEESPRHERLRRQKEEALAAIRDAEFDFQLGKLSEPDYQQLRARLEAQALAAMSEMEKQGDGDSR